MTSGMPRREGTRDNLAGQQDVQPVTIQGPGVANPRVPSAPNRSAQERVLSQISNWSGGKLQQAVNKQQEKDTLDGQMAYQQGKAIEDLQMEGNKFALEGYMLMDAQTIASSLLAAQREEIANSSYELNPEQYRARYVNRLDAMLEGKDPRTAELVRKQMADHMPTLVADHTAAHVSYQEGRNWESLERSIDVISRDPTASDQLLEFAQGGDGSVSAGLSDARRQSATVSGVVRAFDNDNPMAYSVLASNGLLGDNLTTAEHNAVRAAQKRFENRRRTEYNEELFNGEQALMRDVERGAVSPSEAVDRLSLLYADHGINMTSAEAGAIYSPALQSQRETNLTGSVLVEEARLRGDWDTVARITQGVVMQVESNGDPLAVGPLIEGGANAGHRARGAMQVMPLTLTDPGFGVTPARNNSPEELIRVGNDYWAAMVRRYEGDIEAAAVAYNAGPGNADKWVKAGRNYAVLPDRKQTEPYAQKVLKGVGHWKAPTASDKLAIAQNQLNATRERLAMDTYESMAPKLADTDDMFRRGEITEGAWRERRDHLYGAYEQERTKADVNHEISVTRAVDAAVAAQAKVTSDEQYKIALEGAETALVVPRMERDEIVNNPASTPDQIAEANQTYITERNAVFDNAGIRALDRGNGEAFEAVLQSTQEAMQRHRQHEEDGVLIEDAITMGYLGSLPKAMQERAFSEEEDRIVGSVQEAVNEGRISPDQADTVIADEINAFIASAGVTDPKLSMRMSAAMRGPLLDNEGNPNPMVVDVVEQYASIKAMNPHAAVTFLDEEARVRAEAVLSRSQNAGLIGEAVRTLGLESKENPLREDPTSYLARPDVIKQRERVIDEYLNTRDIGVLHAMWQSDATLDQRRDLSDEQRTSMNSPKMREFLQNELDGELSRLQSISPQFKPAELATMALENMQRRTEIIGGNAVMLDRGQDIRHNFFGDRAGDFMHDGAINSAVAEWLRSDEALEQYPELDDTLLSENLPAWMQSGMGAIASALGMEFNPAMSRNEAWETARTGFRPFVAYGVKGDVILQYLRPNGSYSDPITVPARRAGAMYMQRRRQELTR